MAVIQITNRFSRDKRECVRELTRTLSDLGSMSNISDYQRTPTTIFHMYILSFKLGIYLSELCPLVGQNFTSIANRPLSRIICHWPRALRLISLRALHEGRGENFFREVRTLLSNCGNHDPATYVDSVLPRLLSRQPSPQHSSSTESPVAQQSHTLSAPHDTFLSYKLLFKYREVWKAFLPTIGDFLLDGRGVWWNDSTNGVTFFDISGPQGPTTVTCRSFTTTTMSDMQCLVDAAWKEAKKGSLPRYC